MNFGPVLSGGDSISTVQGITERSLVGSSAPKNQVWFPTRPRTGQTVVMLQKKVPYPVRGYLPTGPTVNQNLQVFLTPKNQLSDVGTGAPNGAARNSLIQQVTHKFSVDKIAG